MVTRIKALWWCLRFGMPFLKKACLMPTVQGFRCQVKTVVFACASNEHQSVVTEFLLLCNFTVLHFVLDLF